MRIDGIDPHRQRLSVVGRLGVVFGQRTQLFWDLRLGESFELLRRLYAVDAVAYRRRLDHLAQALELGKGVMHLLAPLDGLKGAMLAGTPTARIGEVKVFSTKRACPV